MSDALLPPPPRPARPSPTPATGRPGVGYWSSYYESNDTGYRNFCPRKGKFNGRYFYKVNTGTFDVHVRTQIVDQPRTSPPPPPARRPTTSATPCASRATAQNCAGPEVWTWNASNTAATGLGGGSNASLIWPLCNASRCATENIEVWALKDICSGSPTLAVNRATITVGDPRPQIAALNVSPTSALAGVYPICSLLAFTADVTGKAPLTYSWTVRSALGQELATGNQTSLAWNTAGVPLGPEVFLDGFETGDTRNWQTDSASASSAKSLVAARELVDQVMEAGSGTFNVELRVDNATASPAQLDPPGHPDRAGRPRLPRHADRRDQPGRRPVPLPHQHPERHPLALGARGSGQRHHHRLPVLHQVPGPRLRCRRQRHHLHLGPAEPERHLPGAGLGRQLPRRAGDLRRAAPVAVTGIPVGPAADDVATSPSPAPPTAASRST